MGPIAYFFFVYVLGGLTFVPLTIAAILAVVYYFSPTATDDRPPPDDPAELKREQDDGLNFKTSVGGLEEQFHRKHDSDVAAGYFAVCREYVPGGVNGKPPERTTPAGEVSAAESPSVYQNMYKGIFGRQQKPTIEPNKATGTFVKKANNVFFVVLRLGHLMLYDDEEQIDVRYVIPLEFHDVSVVNGGVGIVPEGELWIKRNAICLTRKPVSIGVNSPTLPFYLFSENMSEKEDFYFALLRNQEKMRDYTDPTPSPQRFERADIMRLFKSLNHSEEDLQTKWLNALMGRMFLAMYKTPYMDEFIRKKLAKKISRVKKPYLISKIALRRIDTGQGAPFITNPRLKDLTVDGDCTVEADVKYSGNARVEIGATAEIDLGKRLGGTRSYELVLAVVCHKLVGHVLIKIKPPPSNRLWLTFESMPKIDMTVEPVVVSKQITYSMILRAIENRIREVVAETIVLPFWDDVAFLDTSQQEFRGGIWKTDVVAPRTEDVPDEIAEDEAEAGGEGIDAALNAMKSKEDRTLSMPVLPTSPSGAKPRANKRASNKTLPEDKNMGSSSGVERPTSRGEPPRALRSTSFASAAGPQLTANHADMDGLGKDPEPSRKRDEAAALLKDLSSRSITASPSESPAGTPPNESSMSLTQKNRNSTLISSSSSANVSSDNLGSSHARQLSDASIMSSPTKHTFTPTPASGTFGMADNASMGGDEQKKRMNFASAAKSLTSTDKKQAIASINAAKNAAQTWGWGVLNRNKQKEAEEAARRAAKEPMGRGQPIPHAVAPLGAPLPPPSRPAFATAFTAPKRKPVPPPLLPKRPEAGGDDQSAGSGTSSPKPPQLPERRNRQSSFQGTDEQADDVLVVEAPQESAPTSPAAGEHHDPFFGHGEDATSAAGRAWQEQTPEQEQEHDQEQEHEHELERALSPILDHEPTLGDAPLAEH